MPVDRVPTGDKFTAEQVRDAVRIMSAARRHGTASQLPEWVREAKRQYTRNYRRENKDRLPARPREQAPTLRALREDGIIDWTAIEIAVNGTRVVSLTRSERLLAAAVMRRRAGLSFSQIAARLGMAQVSTLLRDVEKGKHKDILASVESGDIDASGSPLKF